MAGLIIGIAGLTIGAYVVGAAVEYFMSKARVAEAESKAARVGREAGRLSRRIFRQRVEIKKLKAMLPQQPKADRPITTAPLPFDLTPGNRPQLPH